MDAPDTPDVPSDGEMTLQIGFKVPTRAATEGYEDGETNENYIDIAGGNYRIYFFDGDNKFIARFEPSGFITIEGSDYTQYSVLGKAPDALVEHSSSFKMVVLANWPEYPEDLNENKENGINLLLEKGVTDIKDICNADWAQYDCLTDGNTSPTAIPLNPSAGRLMPFYGVHTYSAVTFKPGVATILTEPVTLLRAMAKVEVILEGYDLGLNVDTLKINRYNTTGYCAPKDVFEQTDYDHNGSWEYDYVKTLHLTNEGENDGDEKELALFKVETGDDTERKWVAYLTEYDNSEDVLKIELPIEDTSYYIRFVEYEEGKPKDGTQINIERNNIYRFRVRVSMVGLKICYELCPWTDLSTDIEFN